MTTDTSPETASFLEDMDAELDSTRRMLERVPDDHAAWRPHEKSKSLSELATHVADTVGLGATILETEELDALERPRRDPLGTAAQLLERLEENVIRLRAALGAADAERLAAEWTLRAGDRVRSGLWSEKSTWRATARSRAPRAGWCPHRPHGWPRPQQTGWHSLCCGS